MFDAKPPARIVSRITRRLGAIVVGVLALLGLYLLLATFVLHGPVNERSLVRSVSGVAGSAAEPFRGCDRDDAQPHAWTCAVYDKEGSGGGRYRVTVRHESSCWRAVLVRDQFTSEGMPRTLDGCVRKLEWSLLD